MPGPLTLLRNRIARGVDRTWNKFAGGIDAPSAAAVRAFERARAEAPMSFAVYAPAALSRAFERNAREWDLARMTPRDFLTLAQPLREDPWSTMNIANLRALQLGEPPLFPEVRHTYYDANPTEFGFGDVPFLGPYVQKGRAPFVQIDMHNGRHRMRALADLLGERTPLVTRIRGGRGVWDYDTWSAEDNEFIKRPAPPRLKCGGLARRTK